MRVLVTGGNGFIGSRFLRKLMSNGGIEVLGIDNTWHKWNHDIPIEVIDLTNGRKTGNLLSSFAPDTIVLNGALKGLENCERNTRAMATNLFSMYPFLDYGLKQDAHVVFISSDMVFGGRKGAPFCESDPVGANNAYGALKVAGEQVVSMIARHSIIRTALVYGPLSAQEVEKFNHKLLDEELTDQTLLPLWAAIRSLGKLKTPLADNVYCTPTFIDDLTRDMSTIVHKGMFGVFHCCGNDRASRYEIGLIAQSLIGKEDFVTSFRAVEDEIRPLDVSLDNLISKKQLQSNSTDLEAGLRLTVQNTETLSECLT